VAKADAAYRNLPTSLLDYNSAVQEICKELDTTHPSDFASSLKKLGVSFDRPRSDFRFAMWKSFAPRSTANAIEIGIPVVVGYETKDAPLYPPEGLFVDATAIYDRVSGQPRLELRSKANKVNLNVARMNWPPSYWRERAFEAARPTARENRLRRHDPAILNVAEATDLPA